MKTRISKVTSGSALTAVAALTVALSFASAQTVDETQRADSNAPVCSEQTLRGSYLFAAQGFNIVSGAAQPKAILEGIDFNGDGTLSVPFATLSINGQIIQAPPGGVGVYTVETSCAGTLKFTNGPSFNIFVRPNGKTLWMIQTDSNTVLQGTVTKVPWAP